MESLRPRDTRARRHVSVVVVLALMVVAAAATVAAGSVAERAGADPTRVLVRVLAHDAKLVGSGVGGARVTVRDAATGETLATGEHQGGTGDTGLIMRQPQERGATIYDTEGAAEFIATLELEEPTVVEIAAEGPLDTPQSVRRATTTLLVVPGFDYLAEGVVLELYGFRITLETPDSVTPGAEIAVRSTVHMMCGCPTEPGGLWDSNDYTILARLHRDGEVVAETPMEFAGETSKYAAVLEAPATSGTVEVEVIAVDAGKANAGRATASVQVGKR